MKKLSALQARMLFALNAAPGPAPARTLAIVTGQSPDGALRAMRRRRSRSTRRIASPGQGRIAPFPCLGHFRHGRTAPGKGLA